MPYSSAPDDISPAAEAYVWGFPLVSVHRTRLLLCSKADTGTINHIDELATPSDRAIVVPNNDTLYSSAWYDLRHGDLTIDVPAMDHADRYWNVMIVDAYTHVAYVCRRHHGVAGTQVRVTFDPTTPPQNDDSMVVNIGTPTAWVIIRVLVESPNDIDTARSLQRAIRVTAPASHPNERTVRAGRATAIAKSGAEFYVELKGYTELDPPAPWHPQLSVEAQSNRPDGTRPLQLRFEAEAMPPCGAFWSLTAYGTDLYLVENDINRWSISDRTPGLVYDDDGSLTLHISADPPASAANWLPVPSGPYLLGMRVYEGHDEVIACDWFPPSLIDLTN